MSIRKSDEAQYFAKLEQANGTHIALFIMCGMTNTPLDPLIVPKDISTMEGNHWAIYNQFLASKGKVKDNYGRTRGFFDGVCELRRIFGRELTEKDFARYVAFETSNVDTTGGTPEQRERWGTGELSRGVPFSDKVYRELDESYEKLAARYKGNADPQLEYNLLTICKRTYIANELMAKGAYRDAATVQKTVDDLMGSEQMRKKDEKPTDRLKIDDLATRLEKNGMFFGTLEEVQEAINKNLIHKQKYGQSVDALDKVIYAMYNATRGNEDMQTVFSLPAVLDIEDEYGEFADEPSDEEKKRARFVNIPAVQFDRADGEDSDEDESEED